MGYTKLKLCGLNLKKQSTEHIDKNSIRPHWRRGHWRQQPYGEELKKKKIIWIRPTLVSQDKGSPETGHIYQVSDSNHTVEDSREVTEA